MKKNATYIWHDEVRAHELDVQGIVNNACYFQYFDNARTKALFAKGIDWVNLHQHNIDIVLTHADISYHFSLKAFDKYQIDSIFTKKGPLRIHCHQTLLRSSDRKLICSVVNTLVCIDRKTNKAILPQNISTALLT
jgi:acyl-CoA thioester hydrolase